MTTLKKQGQLEYLELTNDLSTAKIALQGAHVFHFQSNGHAALLWLSETSFFSKEKAIRGGIPICWPWFGAHPDDPKLPNHGFARTALWKHLHTEEINKGTTRVVLGLQDCEESRALWPFRFELNLEVMLTHELKLSLRTKNLDDKAFELTQALHSYLRIEDIHQTQVKGLEEHQYYDKVEGTHANLQKGILCFKGETDRIYQDLHSPVYLSGDKNTIRIQTGGSNTLVIWNPGEKRARNMPDLYPYETMLCVESANALDDVVLLQPGEEHTLSTLLTQVD